MGAEKISQELIKTVQVTGQTDVHLTADINSEEHVKKKTETKCDCGYFSDSTDELMKCYQHQQGVMGEDVVIESTDGHEVNS